MSLSESFNGAGNVHFLAKSWLQHLDKELVARGVDCTVKTGAAGAVSLVAPAALLALVIQKHYTESAPKTLSVLLLGKDPMTLMDDGRWLNYAASFSGYTGMLDVSTLTAEPIHSSLREAAVGLNLPAAMQVDAADAQHRDWDLVLWVHPSIESELCAEELRLALGMYERGIPVYAAMYNELDAIVQSYGVSHEGLEFSWLDTSSSKENLSMASVNRFGISTGELGMEGGWGAVLTRMAPAHTTVSQEDWRCLKLAMQVRKLQADDDSVWRFGEALAGVAFNRYIPIALIGNLAVDQTTGVLLSQCPFTNVLKIVGHLCAGATKDFPRTHFELAAWGARIKLMATSRLTREDKKRDEILSLLKAEFEDGLVEAGIAMARALESRQTPESTAEAFEIYKAIGNRHYLSAYALAHEAYSVGDELTAIAYFKTASGAGYPPAQTDYARLLRDAGQHEEAGELLAMAIKHGDKEASFLLGEQSIMAGDYPDALAHLKAAWMAGHEQAHDVSIWLCNQMLEHGVGKRSTLKRHLKDVTFSKNKRERLQKKLDREIA